MLTLDWGTHAAWTGVPARNFKQTNRPNAKLKQRNVTNGYTRPRLIISIPFACCRPFCFGACHSYALSMRSFQHGNDIIVNGKNIHFDGSINSVFESVPPLIRQHRQNANNGWGKGKCVVNDVDAERKLPYQHQEHGCNLNVVWRLTLWPIDLWNIITRALAPFGEYQMENLIFFSFIRIERNPSLSRSFEISKANGT